ncbi:5-aminolevulinate synthase, partial [Staphylococcus felis]|nr:5-aminolevulinate synthase [Staphylococcus felis]
MYSKHIMSLIEGLKVSHQYREFNEINRVAGKYPLAYSSEDHI